MSAAMEARKSAVPSRVEKRFADLKAANRAGFVTYMVAGDPDLETSFEILRGLPAAGADIIELGMPFTDPMADGPAIQAGALRSLKAGGSLAKTLDMVARFRQGDDETPIILMGYYNPIYRYGVDRFLADAMTSGVDGFIVVDLPAEEDQELCLPALDAGLHFIRLATPTTDDERLPAIMKNTSGFLYYVSVAGVTGTKSAASNEVAEAVNRLRKSCDIPIAVGFGITEPQQAAEVARVADAAVVGTAIVRRIADGIGQPNLVATVLGFVADLGKAIANARA
ncbi:MAG: tryptophan synthase subunit alpha [Pseudomonadota bacterium]